MRPIAAALLLVLVLGSAAVAQEDPSPSVTPLDAAEHLTAVVPSEVGGIELTVQARSPEDLAGLAGGVDALRDLLTPLGKELSDVRMASAKSVDSNELGQSRLGFIAVRVDGVTAEPLVEPFFRMLFGVDAADMPAPYRVEWQDFSGRPALVLLNDDHDGWGAFIPAGEVIFAVTTSVDQPEVTIEEVLAVLP